MIIQVRRLSICDSRSTLYGTFVPFPAVILATLPMASSLCDPALIPTPNHLFHSLLTAHSFTASPNPSALAHGLSRMLHLSYDLQQIPCHLFPMASSLSAMPPHHKLT